MTGFARLMLAATLLASHPGFAFDNKSQAALAVQESHGECTTADRTVVCGELPRLLRELGVPVQQSIVVSAQGTGDAAHQRAENVVAILEDAGFQNVTIGGFL